MNTGNVTKTRQGVSLRARLAVGFALLGLLAVGASLTISYLNLQQQLRADLKQRLLNIVSLAALQQNGDAFIKIQSPDDPAFDQIRLQNLKIKYSDSDLRFVYTMRYDENGIYFVVDAVVPGEVGASPYGTRYEEPGPVLAANYKTLNQPMVENSFYTDEYGTFISAYAPFYTSDGKFAGIIGADITANNILARENQTLLWYLAIFIIALPVIGIAGWWLGNNLSGSIIDLTNVAGRIASGELDYHPELKPIDREIKQLVAAVYSMETQLRSLISDLEKRVADRTKALERRAVQIQAAADIGAAATRYRDPEVLLEQAARLINQRFGFYHVGIFLVDAAREYAVLQASNSEGGKSMLARNHKLKVGQTGIVGFVTATGQARIALDVGKDAVFFDNPDLPQTRSEMALPLVVGGKILGALDVQSTTESAFSEEDISTLRVLADQIAIGIDNARLFVENQKSLEATRRAYGELGKLDWQNLLQKRDAKIGYVSLSDDQTIPSTNDLDPDVQKEISNGKPVLQSDGYVLYIPILARGQAIGAVRLEKPAGGNKWTNDEVSLANQLSEQLGASLESARLYNDTIERAERETVISGIANKISAKTQVDTIIRTTIEELANAYGGTDILLQLGVKSD